MREVTIAKLRTQRAAFDAIDACLQILAASTRRRSWSGPCAMPGSGRSAAAPTRS